MATGRVDDQGQPWPPLEFHCRNCRGDPRPQHQTRVLMEPLLFPLASQFPVVSHVFLAPSWPNLLNDLSIYVTNYALSSRFMIRRPRNEKNNSNKAVIKKRSQRLVSPYQIKQHKQENEGKREEKLLRTHVYQFFMLHLIFLYSLTYLFILNIKVQNICF